MKRVIGRMKALIRNMIHDKKPVPWVVGLVLIVFIGMLVGLGVWLWPEETSPIGGDGSMAEASSEVEAETDSGIDLAPSTGDYIVAEFQADLTHDGQADVIRVIGDVSEEGTPKYTLSVYSGGVRIYTMEQTQNNAFYYLVNVEGQDCLMYYSFDTEKAYMSYQYTLGYLLGGTLARKDEAQMMTYHALVKDLDKTKWAEFAQKVNGYFASGYLLMGIENQKLVYSTQDNRMTYEENFRWMVEDDIGTAMTWEELLDLYAQSTMDNDVLSPERVMYETTADLTHDGIADLVQTVQYSISYEFDLKMGSDTSAFVRVYRGLGDGSYESSPCYTSDAYVSSHAGNGTYVLTEQNGKDYLMKSIMDISQGYGYYSYSVFYITDTNRIKVTDSYESNFCIDMQSDLWATMEHPDEAVADMKTHIAPWVEKGTILFVLDIWVEVFVSTEEDVYPASTYYDCVWLRDL